MVVKSLIFRCKIEEQSKDTMRKKTEEIKKGKPSDRNVHLGN